jgi:predicted negative regulator of RcsB-dependent stress response
MAGLAADTVGGLPLSGLGQLGAVGVVLGVLFWFAYQVWKGERTRADDNAAEVKRLNEKITDVYVPSMEKWADALTEQKRLLEQLRDTARRR